MVMVMAIARKKLREAKSSGATGSSGIGWWVWKERIPETNFF